jgi:putative transposase
VCRACQYWGLSRQAYYQGMAREQAAQVRDRHIIEQVMEVRRTQPRLGARKLQYVLRKPLSEAGVSVGRDVLFGILRQARLLVVPRRAYHKTTNSHHRFYRHPNLLKAGPQQCRPDAAEQVWVADITYLPTQGAFAYLSLITDMWSRRIVGYHVHDTLQTRQVSQALKMALKTRQTRQALIHHSDRGIQYCSDEYQRLHSHHGITCSMTDGYDCYQNALAERVNGILKNELLLHRPADLEQARRMVGESVNIYNQQRPHLSLKMKTPDEVHRASIARINQSENLRS